MPRFVLLRAVKYALMGWVAAFVASCLRDGVSVRGALGALWFGLIWGIGGAAVALYQWPQS